MLIYGLSTVETNHSESNGVILSSKALGAKERRK
jgi:hypothetical protein